MQSFDIKWYELEVELTDHFVSSIEEILSKSLNLLLSSETVCWKSFWKEMNIKEIEKKEQRFRKRIQSKSVKHCRLFEIFQNVSFWVNCSL
jgi:hypothetical protein